MYRFTTAQIAVINRRRRISKYAIKKFFLLNSTFN